jgi:asparagine synthetase B (glutamine-hydrolysing)
VRVPFCDHRLVEYVFNIPWRLKVFDRRAKSILRAAAAHLLPQSIVAREKSAFPATQDPSYERLLRRDVSAIISDASHPAAGLFNRRAVEARLARPMCASSLLWERVSLERVRTTGTWVRDYGITLDL